MSARGREGARDGQPSLEESRRFWEERGQLSTGLASTMIAEHQRYLDYVHAMEVRYLSRWLPPGGPRILDLGCGAGRLALALAARASRVVGMDLSQGLLQQARARASASGVRNVEFAQHVLGQDLGAAAFDVVLLSGVLNCVDDQAGHRGLERSARALRPGGLLYLRNNCANVARFHRRASASQAPAAYRTAAEYTSWVRQIPALSIVDERFLFAPFCWPNLLYYHVLPRPMRDTTVARALLAGGFVLESQTSELRLRVLSRLYPPMLRIVNKPTSFRVLVARKVG